MKEHVLPYLTTVISIVIMVMTEFAYFMRSIDLWYTKLGVRGKRNVSQLNRLSVNLSSLLGVLVMSSHHML